MHGADDVCFGQKLVSNKLMGSHCNSKSVTYASPRGNRGQQANIIGTLWRGCIHPLNCEDVEHSKQTPPLSCASERDDNIQVFLTLACRAWSTHRR